MYTNPIVYEHYTIVTREAYVYFNDITYESVVVVIHFKSIILLVSKNR